jgi:hypothetical protein
MDDSLSSVLIHFLNVGTVAKRARTHPGCKKQTVESGPTREEMVRSTMHLYIPRAHYLHLQPGCTATSSRLPLLSGVTSVPVIQRPQVTKGKDIQVSQLGFYLFQNTDCNRWVIDESYEHEASLEMNQESSGLETG